MDDNTTFRTSELLHSGLIGAYIYDITVNNLGNLSALEQTPWTLAVIPSVGAIPQACVQVSGPVILQLSIVIHFRQAILRLPRLLCCKEALDTFCSRDRVNAALLMCYRRIR